MHVLVIDSHELFRGGVVAGLTGNERVTHCAAVATLQAGMERLAREPCDLVLIDERLIDGPPEHVVLRLHTRYPALATGLFVTHIDAAALTRLMASGISAVLPRSATIERVRTACALVAEGMTCVAQELFETGPADLSSRAAPGLVLSADACRHLPERQLEVVKLLLQGHPNKRIAMLMGISTNTVKGHVSAALRSLGARNRTELVHLACSGPTVAPPTNAPVTLRAVR